MTTVRTGLTTVVGSASCFLASALGASSLLAQGVAGYVTDETGSPVAAAVVTLKTAEGSIKAWDLTNTDGSYDIQVLDAGEFALDVDALGYSSLSLPLVELTDGVTTAVRFELPVQPIALIRLSLPLNPSRDSTGSSNATASTPAVFGVE